MTGALLGNVKRFPVSFTHGEGVYLYDDAGRRYLDFLAGIAVCSLGHSHPAVTETIAAQAGRLLHVSNLFYTPEGVAAAERLVGLLGPGRIFFCNSGTEANEAAMKLVRKRAWRAGEPERTEIVAVEASFHGRTIGSLSITIQPAKWDGFAPLPGSVVTVPFGDVDALDRAITDRTAGVFIEAIQGEGGVRPLPADFVNAARRLTTERGALLVADEIQCGVARTGRWWGFEHYGVVPDVVTLAKALGNGVPVGAMWTAESCADALQPSDHSTTQGGNPLASAVVCTVLDVIEREGLVEHAARMERVLREELSSIGEVRGKGLLLAVDLGRPAAGDVVRSALDLGLIVNDVTASAVRLAPPLVVDAEQVREAAALLRKAVEAA